VTIHLSGRVPPGGRRTLEEFLAEAVEFSEAPGGIRVRLLWDRAAPDRFVEVIEYADEATYAADQRRVDDDPTMAALLARRRALLSGALAVAIFDDTWPRDIGSAG